MPYAASLTLLPYHRRAQTASISAFARFKQITNPLDN